MKLKKFLNLGFEHIPEIIIDFCYIEFIITFTSIPALYPIFELLLFTYMQVKSLVSQTLTQANFRSGWE